MAQVDSAATPITATDTADNGYATHLNRPVPDFPPLFPTSKSSFLRAGTA